jgi:choice-of-anchor A domain-containing protein
LTGRSGVNFTLAGEQLRNTSQSLCSAANTSATAAEVADFGAITLRASGAANESFTVQASDLSRATGMRLIDFDRSTVNEVVINVVGNATATFSNFFVDVGAVPLTSIVWNICEANLVVIQGFQFPGTSKLATHTHAHHRCVDGALNAHGGRWCAHVQVSCWRPTRT